MAAARRQRRTAAADAGPDHPDRLGHGGAALCGEPGDGYAENPATGFLPSTGPLTHFRLPEEGIRVDSAVEEGGEVSPHYDPMIAKLIAHGGTREAAAEALG